MTRPISRSIAVVAGLLLVFALAAPVLADAELERTTPEDGAVLDQPPPRITLEFSERLDRDRSSVRLVMGGERVATGGVIEDDPRAMAVEDLALDPGEYEVRWTAGSQDGHIVRGRFTFTIRAAAAATLPATPNPSPTGASPTPADNPVVEPSPQPSADTPAATPTADGAAGAAGAADVALPIVVGLLVVAGVGAYLLRRGRGSA